ncbi:MBL fold metallo-hydrolase [Aneurinibacillus sp. Ricciae_BoGa-3]|uniref:MBL fold metallo-hydrolase n=1 Tax=Aneurinibacillus sp. Ricciae_BoGa-3 TaxID=3022697 RepID=UPI0023404099|nr:MBL fold metallo-hydrolase [Aneurinibacillus sp. Ricciae_BoGa-3]WCK56614.1 MBL fold metallo-hydrolase [Aneurinibacillus sp. Ricciae_BoGa-3]
MRVQKHGFIYQLTFLPNFFPVNCYLLEEDSELTLIDAALSYTYKGILKTAQAIGKPITRIVLTHAHEDHVGALDRLKHALPNAVVMLSKRDTRLMNGDRTLDSEELQRPVRGGVPKWLKTRPDQQLEEGDRIGSLTALYTPGHTPGSMSFLDTRDHSLIAGDALQTRGGIAVAGVVKPFFPFPAWGTWSLQTAVESTRKLIEVNPSLLAVGHGHMLNNPAEAMQHAIKDAEKFLERRGPYAART